MMKKLIALLALVLVASYVVANYIFASTTYYTENFNLNGSMFCGTFSFLLIAFIQWVIKRDHLESWKAVVIGIVMIVVPFIIVRIIKIPDNSTSGVCLVTPVIWGLILVVSLFESDYNYKDTRNYMVVIGLFLSILFLAFPFIRSLASSTIIGIMFGLLTTYCWEQQYVYKE